MKLMKRHIGYILYVLFAIGWMRLGINLPKYTINTWAIEDYHWVKISGLVVLATAIICIIPYWYLRNQTSTIKTYKIEVEALMIGFGIIVISALCMCASTFFISDIYVEENPVAYFYVFVSRILFSFPIGIILALFIRKAFINKYEL